VIHPAAEQSSHESEAQSRTIKLPQTLSVALAILFCVGLGILLTWPQTLSVWQHGSFDDPDDAMRLVQVRALLAGQNWFDMTAYRIDPPYGSELHWSRIVDVPVALLIKIFSLFTQTQEAERLARLSFPLLLQCFFYAAMARLAFLMIGRDAIWLTITAVFLSGLMLGQFRPGRIDHHAPQMLLLVLMLCALIEGLQKKHVANGWHAAICMALSLAISLENLPFLLVGFALVVAFWIWNGDSFKPLLKGLGQGLLIALPTCYLLIIGPQHWLQSFPDAFSFGHLVGSIAAGVFCWLAGTFSLQTRQQRILAAIVGGVITLGATYLLGEGVLHEPFYGIDPLLRQEWLRNVKEAWYFTRLMQETPDAATIFMAPLVFSLAGLGLAFVFDTEHRAEWLILFSITAVAALAGFWLVRVLGVIAPLATLGGVWLAVQLMRRIRSALAMPAALALLLPFTSIPWALAVTSDTEDTHASQQACLASSGFEALAHLPQGLILAPIDYGAHILAFTDHDVLAAPYHRNNRGNKLALTALLAPPEKAEAIVRESKARYIVVCRAADRSDKADLWHTLTEGKAPSWLREIPMGQSRLKVFAVNP